MRTGNPGNKGGTGRPPNFLKNLAIEELVELIPRMAKIAMGEEMIAKVKRKGPTGKIVEYTQTPEIRDQTKAFSELAKLAKETPGLIAAARLEDAEDRSFTLVLGERTLGEMQDDE